MAAKAGVTGKYLIAHPKELELRVKYLLDHHIIDREDLPENGIAGLNDIDAGLIGLCYDANNKQVIVHNNDEHGEWEGYLQESYEEAMERQSNILNQEIDQ